MTAVRQRLAIAAAAAAIVAGAASCKQEEHRFRETPPSATSLPPVAMGVLKPGPVDLNVGTRNPYEDNAYAVAEGKRLFNQMNCSGCHSQGGGGMGPALIDDEWIYGSDPQNIFATILEGRPNGMPSWRGKLPNYEIWQIVAYVRALGGFQNKAVRTGRNDDMMVKESEQARYRAHPTATTPPPPK